MNIRINKMSLQNFKGIKYLDIDAGGDSLTIYGDNATGKTTIFDAFMWLLFNKDSLGRSDFGIKTQDENGNTLHNLEHSVECEMLIDETVLTLKKVFAEKWTKKRGSAEAEFSGHETKYYVNEVPTTKKEYEQKIAGVIDETLFKVITNPLYFNEHLKWQERRGILLNLCGNISDDELIANNAEFSPLLEELKGRTVQEYKKIIQSKQTAINDDLKAIPQRIAEANLAIPETVINVDENAKADIERNISDLKNKIDALRLGAGVADANAEIRQLKTDKEAIEKSVCNVSALETEINTIKNKLSNANADIKICNQQLYNIDGIISDFERKADALRKEWYEVSKKQYSDNGICPTCGQNLPAEQIEAAKVKFNTERAARLEAITEQGKQANAEAESRRKLRLEVSEKLNNLKKDVDGYVTEIDRLMREIDKAKADFEEERTKKIDDINLRIAEAEKTAQNGAESVEAHINTINEEISIERAKLDEINKAIAGCDIAERQKKRIADLEADEKRLAAEYATLEKTAFLIDKFIKHKVDLLSEEINSHFRHAKFKLFDVQINGGVAECCEVTYKGVPYSDLNNASRINIGLDIINTLCTVNGKTAPIIIDNAESVTNIIPTKSQKICLVVSATDDMLRVEKGV